MISLKKEVIVFFFVYLLVGTIIATIGVITLPVGDACSNFWPAIVLQVLGGIWFGWVGVIGGTIFPIFSNLIVSGALVHTIGFIPANFLQSLVPFLIYRKFQKTPGINSFKDFVFFFFYVCLISMAIAALVGATSFYVIGTREFVISKYIEDVVQWWMFHFRMLLLFGVPLMIWVAPTIVEANIVKMYWSKKSANLLKRKFALKIFTILGSITIFPLVVIGIYQMITIDAKNIVDPNYLAIALSSTFFALLIITAVIRERLSSPINMLTRKIDSLSSKHDLPEAIVNSKDEEVLYGKLLEKLDELFDNSLQLERLKGAHEVASEVAHIIRSDTVDELVQKGISHILETGREIKTRAGDGLQSYNVNYVLTNSRNRLHFLRKEAVRYLCRELVAYFRGSLKVEDGLAQASKFWRKLASLDGRINSNYGYYIFYQRVKENRSMTQYEWARERIIQNPDSRRAIININQPYHKSDTKDFPCTVSLQFYIREGALCCEVFSRSTDVMIGLPYDIGFFSVVTEMLWADLKNRSYPDLNLGYTTMRTIFTQIYAVRYKLAKKTLKKSAKEEQSLKMPQIANTEEVFADIYSNSHKSEFMNWIYKYAELEDLE